DAVEVGLSSYAIYFLKALVHLLLNRIDIRRRIGTVLGLNRQLTDTLQVIVDFVQRAFRCLSDGNTIVSVTGGLRQTLDVCREAVSNSLTSSVVLGAVDAQTGGQAFDGAAQSVLGLGQVVLRNQSKVVGVDYRHG